jgi:hypothetical protein
MKLKLFNANNLPSIRVGKPYIRMNSKTGLVAINSKASEILGIGYSDMVHFFQNEEEEEEGDWFIEKVQKDGFALRYKENQGHVHVFNSTQLVRLIFQSVGYEGIKGQILIGEPVKNGKHTMFTLITAGLRNE